MIGGMLKRVFGSSNDRVLTRLQGKVNAINSIENDLEPLSDEVLRTRTDAFRDRIAGGESLDDILVEASQEKMYYYAG